MHSKIQKAMVLAAGYGTRLRPLTDRLPKPLVPVAGKPMIEYALDRLRAYGIQEVIINVSYLKEPLLAYAAAVRGVAVQISAETEPLECPADHQDDEGGGDRGEHAPGQHGAQGQQNDPPLMWTIGQSSHHRGGKRPRQQGSGQDPLRSRKRDVVVLRDGGGERRAKARDDGYQKTHEHEGRDQERWVARCRAPCCRHHRSRLRITPSSPVQSYRATSVRLRGRG